MRSYDKWKYFNDCFLTDGHNIAIPLTSYAIRYSISLGQRDGELAPSLADLKAFVLSKLIESEENLSPDQINDRIYLNGTLHCHRIFFDWLLTQTME